MLPKAVENWKVCLEPFWLFWAKSYYTCPPNYSTLISESLALKIPQDTVTPWKHNWTFNQPLSSSILTSEIRELSDCLFPISFFILSKYLFFNSLLQVAPLSGRMENGITLLLPSICHTNYIYFQSIPQCVGPCPKGDLSLYLILTFFCLCVLVWWFYLAISIA